LAGGAQLAGHFGSELFPAFAGDANGALDFCGVGVPHLLLEDLFLGCGVTDTLLLFAALTCDSGTLRARRPAGVGSSAALSLRR